MDIGPFNVSPKAFSVPPPVKVQVDQRMAGDGQTETAKITYKLSSANDLYFVDKGNKVKEIHRTLNVPASGKEVPHSLTFDRGPGDRMLKYLLTQVTVVEVLGLPVTTDKSLFLTAT